MKKLACLIFICCFFSTLAAAQKTVRKRTKPPVADAAATNQPTGDSERISPTSPTNRIAAPITILEKPRASYPSQYTGCAQGKVVLRVTFLASGEIGRIFVISGMGNGLTEQAVEAAKKIKFLPAIKDGSPTTSAKPVEYVFRRY